eukprot:3776482-Pleurochrysis_carterae.AAC.1
MSGGSALDARTPCEKTATHAQQVSSNAFHNPVSSCCEIRTPISSLVRAARLRSEANSQRNPFKAHLLSKQHPFTP